MGQVLYGIKQYIISETIAAHSCTVAGQYVQSFIRPQHNRETRGRFYPEINIRVNYFGYCGNIHKSCIVAGQYISNLTRRQCKK